MDTLTNRLGEIMREQFDDDALQVTDERRAAGAELSAAGMHHLESEPQDLASSLVSFYFHVKEKSLL